MSNNTRAEQKIMIISGISVFVIMLILIIVSVRMPILQKTSKQDYPQLELTSKATDYVSNSPLLKKKIGMGPIIMKMFGSNEGDVSTAAYRATMDGMSIYTKFGEFDSDSDELYQVYCELLGVSSIEELREEAVISTLQSGYAGKYKCNYRMLECKKKGNILFLETYLEDNLCYFSFGFAYDSKNVSKEQLQNAAQYLFDGMTTMKCKEGYYAKERELTLEEKIAERDNAVIEENRLREEHERLMELPPEELDALITQEASKQETDIEYVDYSEEYLLKYYRDGLENDNLVQEVMDYVLQVTTEKNLPLDTMYLALTVKGIMTPHDAKLVSLSEKEYLPIFRGYRPEMQEEFIVFEIDKANCYGYYDYISNVFEGDVWTVDLLDYEYTADMWQDMSYEEFEKEYSIQNANQSEVQDSNLPN